jgi:tetratricopeptide (TPR) repeat protein
MSPEQAKLNALDIDTRSDIYALGVLLYELLTGTTPFDTQRLHQAAFDEVLRIIREEEPPRPSTRLSTTAELPAIAANRGLEPRKLSGLVRGELDWIVMKCLEKDRNQRYETANGLAHDIERYLRDEPVQAGPPSVWYRLRKFVRRNIRALTTLALLLALVLGAVGAIAAIIGWAVRDREALREQVAHDQAVRQTRVEGEARQALQEVETFYRADKLPEARGALQRGEALLAGSEGAGELQHQLRQWRTDLALVARLEEIRIEQTAVRNDHFDHASADSAYQKAFREYGLDVEALDPEKAAAGVRASAIRASLMAALDDWMLVKWVGGRPGMRRLFVVARRADADPWRDQFRTALRHWDGNALGALVQNKDLLSQPPATMRFLSVSLYGTGQLPRAIEVLQQTQQRYPNDFWINHHLGLYLTYEKPPRAADAVGFLRAAVALRPECPGARVNLGKALEALGLNDEALIAFREATRLKPDYAMAWSNVGGMLFNAQRDYNGALVAFQKAAQLKADDPTFHFNLGLTYLRQRKPKEAETELRIALRLKPEYAEALKSLGTVLCQFKQDYSGAVTAFQEAARLKPGDAELQHNLGTALVGKGEMKEAAASYREALRLNPNYAGAHFGLGVVYLRQGNWVAAEAAFRDSLRLDPSNPEAHNNLGVALFSQGDFDGAVRAYEEALRRRPAFVNALYGLGRCYCRQNRPGEAVARLKDALRLDPDHTPSLTELAWVLTTSSEPSVRDPKQALQAARKAVKLAPQTNESWLTLGTALYRAEDWKACIGPLEKALALEKGGNTPVKAKIFLAMACWRLGKHDEARKWYAEAARGVDPRASPRTEARRLQTEAAQLLKISE